MSGLGAMVRPHPSLLPASAATAIEVAPIQEERVSFGTRSRSIPCWYIGSTDKRVSISGFQKKTTAYEIVG